MNEFLLQLDMQDDARHEFIGLLTEKKIRSGFVLFDHGDLADTLYFVMKGRLAVYKSTGFPEKMQVIALLDSGAVVGEAALMDGHLRKTRVTATQDSVVLCLGKDDFEIFARNFPHSALLFIKYLLLTVSLRLEKNSKRLALIL